MSRKSTIKFMLMMMELIVLMILEVHANNNTPVSSAPTETPNKLHIFEHDTGDKDMSYNIDRCIESTVTKDIHAFYIAKNLLECLFNDPMHPKDYPITFGEP